MNDVLNSDEHNTDDDNDGYDNETLEEANDMGVEIISSIGSAHSQRSSCSSRDNEAANNHANQEASLATNNDTQLQTSSLMSVLKAPKAYGELLMVRKSLTNGLIN